MSKSAPCVVPLRATCLTQKEQARYQSHPPWGYILFARNLKNAEQIRRLTDQLHSIHDGAPILIDQEGGNIQSLRPPANKTSYPSAASYKASYERNKDDACALAYETAKTMGAELKSFGINIVCAPVLDVFQPQAHKVIGTRSYGSDPEAVTDLGRAQIKGFLDGGVIPIMKHIPGHGRAMVDSHKDLPQISSSLEDLKQCDFHPFKVLAPDCPIAMTAHIVYTAIDPAHPATTSKKLIAETIREDIGFHGVLISDALEMQALRGSFVQRVQNTLAAGCDLALSCSNVDMDTIESLTELPSFTAQSQARCDALIKLMRDRKMAGFA